MWARITQYSDRASYHPRWVSLSLLGRSARQLRTLTTEILSFDEMRRDTPLDAVIEKGKRLAAHVLEAAEADIQYRGGVFEITGTDRKIALFELADRAKQLGDSLDAKSSFDAAPSFPNGVPRRRGRDRPRHGAHDACRLYLCR